MMCNGRMIYNRFTNRDF